MLQGPTSPFQDPDDSFDNSSELITHSRQQDNGEFSFENDIDGSRSVMPTPKINVVSPSSLRFDLPHSPKKQ
jgi:phosphoglucomutase